MIFFAVGREGFAHPGINFSSLYKNAVLSIK
jgi:hypothetical protein